MQIFLQILAVIGIVLLCIIGLILLIAALVLFVPIRYRVKAQKDAELTLDVKVTWLAHFVTFQYSYPEPQEFILRILGIRIPLDKGDSEEAIRETSKEVNAEPQPESKTEPQTEPKFEPETAEEPRGKQTVKDDTEPAEEKMSLRQKIEFKTKPFFDIIKKIVKEIKYYWELLQKNENRLLFQRCKSRLLKIFKSVKPKVLDVDATVGTGSPDTTGYILAVYGMLSPLYGYRMSITPDFENKVFEGKVFVKGKITIFVLVYQGIRIYFDKQMQKLIQILKRKEN